MKREDGARGDGRVSGGELHLRLFDLRRGELRRAGDALDAALDRVHAALRP